MYAIRSYYVILDEHYNILADHYDYVHGKPFDVLHKRLVSLLGDFPAETIKGIAITGTGGKMASAFIGGLFVNEIIAQATSAGRIYPDAHAVIEIGGEDSKLIILEREPADEHARLVDFEMNSICAAGTGSFP